MLCFNTRTLRSVTLRGGQCRNYELVKCNKTLTFVRDNNYSIIG